MEQEQEEVEREGAQSEAVEGFQPGERRPSIVKLQGMLRRVSQSPFHKQYSKNFQSTSESNESSMNDSHAKQNDMIDRNPWNPFHSSPQNGINGGLSKVNPFYAYFKDSSSTTADENDNKSQDSGAHEDLHDQSLDSIFAPPPEFQSTPLDLKPDSQTGGNLQTTPSEQQMDISKTASFKQTQNLFQIASLSQKVPPSDTPDAVRTTPFQPQDLFETPPSKTTDLFQAPPTKGDELFQAPPTKGHDLFQDPPTKGHDLFKAPPTKREDPFQAPPTKGDDLFKARPTKIEDPFQAPPTKGDDLFKARSTKIEDPFQAPPTKGDGLFKARPTKIEDPFQAPPTKGDGLFKAPPTKGDDLFQASSTKGEDLFQASTSNTNLFQPTFSKGQDLFQATPFESKDLFQTPSNVTTDIFQSFPPKEQDTFQSSPANKSYDIFQTSPPSMSDIFSSSSFERTPDFFKDKPSNSQHSIHRTPSDDNVLTTPYGTKHNVLPSTPSSLKHGTPQARAMSPTPKPSGLTQVKSSSSPPRPAPRTKPPMLPNKPERWTPKPASRTKQTVQDHKSEEVEDDSVFENVLLIGQERCVEDWPEDSPEIHPDWKPSGRLRLRRESIKVARVADGGSGEEELEDNGSGKQSKPKKGRIFKFISRRGSKDKFADNLKDGDGSTLRRGSKEKFHESKDAGSNSLRRRSKEGFLDDDYPQKGADLFSAVENEDQEQNEIENGKPKRPFKFKMSLVHRRGSKGKFSSESLEKASDHQSPRRRSKEGFLDDDFPQKGADLFSAGMVEDNEQDGIEDCKPKKPLKLRVSQILHRGSKDKLTDEMRNVNGHSPQGLKDDCGHEEVTGPNGHTARRWSEVTSLNENPEKEDEHDGHGDGDHGDGDHGFKRTTRVKIKFVPQRGYAITLEKGSQDEPMGAHGYSPRRGSKDKPQDELKGACGYTPRKQSKDDLFDNMEEAKGYTPHPRTKGFLDDDFPQKGADLFSAGEVEDDEQNGMEDRKPKKPLKLPHLNHQRSKSPEERPPAGARPYSPRRPSEGDFLEDVYPQKGADLFHAGDLEDEGQNGIEDCKPKKPSKFKAPLVNRWKSKTTQETVLHESTPIGSARYTPQRESDDDYPQKRSDLFSPGDYEDDEQNEMEECKAKKPSKFKSQLKRHRGTKSKEMTEYPPGATSSDYYMSEAAEAEWLSAQMDERLAGVMEGEEKEEGDTDSLMEWWNTVEQWDELPSDDEDKTIKKDETRSFTQLAEKVHLGLRVFNKMFTERAEVLWQYVITLHAIADDISNFHKKAKIANITGGTTTAVGGVAAIAGVALAPFTFGASLIITAVGVGVATAGGITSASAAISDNVNSMHDRKKMEVVLEDYEARLEDVAKVLRFVLQGLWRLRGHPFLRAGTQHYSGDWEVRRAVHMISLVDRPAGRAGEVTEGAVMALRGLFKGMDNYFAKDSRELKKGCKKEVVSKIRQVAQMLHEGLVELNAIREELQDANGNI